MKAEVRITRSFKKAVKPLLKKYSSLLGELAKLETELLANPKIGTPLGSNVYKIRLKIKSKGKGKSGGAGDFVSGNGNHRDCRSRRRNVNRKFNYDLR